MKMACQIFTSPVIRLPRFSTSTKAKESSRKKV